MQKISKSKTLFLMLLVSIFATLSFLIPITFAYFRFMKVYDGEGYLPILKIDYIVENGNKNSLKNISYDGQDAQNVVVKITTMGNNIGGYVRAKIVVIWQNQANNIIEKDGNYVEACKVVVSQDFVYENGYYYSLDKIEPDLQKVLIEKICFENLPNEYRSQKVDIVITVDIVQSKENW